MRYAQHLLETIGHTPLVKLNRVVQGVSCLVLAKVEYFNPGQSVKDRPALRMVEDAEARGLLRPGGTIVEPTSGNTGVGLAIAAAIKGYRCIFTMPDKMSQEKRDVLRAYGAEVIITPSAVSNDHPDSYYSVANRLTREIPGAYQPNQFHNAENPASHYATTGPEIWDQTDGRITHLIASTGTGGTLSGTAKFIKERNPAVQVIGVDPEGSIYSGDTPRPYLVEGVGMNYLPDTMDMKIVDRWARVSDRDGFQMTRRLAREEGLLVSGSSGMAVFGALRVARELPSDAVVVVILPGSGRGYISKIFNDEWMRQHGMLEASPAESSVASLLNRREWTREIVAIAPDASLEEAIACFETHGISQVPVIESDRVVGSLSESSLLQVAFRGQAAGKLVRDVMGPAYRQIDEHDPVQKVYEALLRGDGAVVVTRGGKPRAVLTKIDLIHHFAHDEVEVIR